MTAHKSSWILVYWVWWGRNQAKQNCPGCCWHGVKGVHSDCLTRQTCEKDSTVFGYLDISTVFFCFFVLKCLFDFVYFFKPFWFVWNTLDFFAWHVWHTGRHVCSLVVINKPTPLSTPLAMVEFSLEPRAIKFALGTTLLSGLLALRLGTFLLRKMSWKSILCFCYERCLEKYII